jgi:hypothetical protein
MYAKCRAMGGDEEELASILEMTRMEDAFINVRLFQFTALCRADVIGQMPIHRGAGYKSPALDVTLWRNRILAEIHRLLMLSWLFSDEAVSVAAVEVLLRNSCRFILVVGQYAGQ